ncbi:MAG TPA: GNAT family N-acetyltransferase [Candidatus Absconditabacterales bacterium]|nr:GNAT family N-acetyltransferase [Candidatus Absconditabacterales bacterium]
MIKPITQDDIDWINKHYKTDMYTIGLQNEFQKVSHDIGFWNPGYVYVGNDTVMNEYRIMGFILGESDSYRSYGEVKNLYVFDGFRGIGIGSKLLEKLEVCYKSIGLYSCELITFLEKSKKFYVKNGYEVIADYEKKHHKNDKHIRRILLSKKL